MTELLVLAALLGSPDWRSRDAATVALSARFDALPVLSALTHSPDPEVAARAALAYRRSLRAAAPTLFDEV